MTLEASTTTPIVRKRAKARDATRASVEPAGDQILS
jgi:hypothetical protein